jgi:D-isomer specific 2-hydroxyacid dehydrogenase, NAD binding domain
MSGAQSSSLHVTRSLSARARATHFHFGEDTAIVAVQHMLRQTVDLFSTAGAMGLDLKNVFALGKIYSNYFPVIRTLRKMGVTVVETTAPEPGEFHSYFERDIERLWQVAAAALARRRIKRILVLDDSGACISNVPAGILERYAVCGVEQTSAGMFLLEEKPPPFAVIAWARSAVKLEIGSPVFSQCFVDKLNTEFLCGQNMKGARLGIIGMGSIGKAVANLLLRQNNEVMFYDPDPQLEVPRQLCEKVTRLDTIEEIMVRFDCVVGCSGRDPFKNKWPLDHKPGIRILSASSGDQEFRPIINNLKGKSGFKVSPDTWDITSSNGPSGPMQIAYLGYPYTFVSRASEAVPTSIVQLETGGLLASLVQGRIYLELCERGQERNCGIHGVSAKAQRFVYETWLRTLKSSGINIAGVFGHDPEMLNAARDESWLTEKTKSYTGACHTDGEVEEAMARFCQGHLKKSKRV